MKTCSKCFEPQPGRACRSCDNKRRRERYASDPRYREKSKEKARKRAKQHPEKVRIEQRRKHLRVTYNLTLEEYDAKLAAQGGACAVCGGPPTTGRFYVDHDHQTGAVRDLLCHGCNVALGMVKDSPELCEKLAKYLRRHG